jgi:hypothetical protein
MLSILPMSGNDKVALLFQPDNMCLRFWGIGRTNIMGRTTEQVAVHKERYLVPLSLNVSKLSGVGEDTLFIGIMEVGGAIVSSNALLCHPSLHAMGL